MFWKRSIQNHGWTWAWFIALFLINTLGILEIVYIFFIAKVPEFRKKLGMDT